MQLAAALALSALGSVGGVLLASVFLLAGEERRARVLPSLISYAVGTLLGVALLALLPEALEKLQPATALGTLLGGVLAFFLLEKLVLWRHCHDDPCEVHSPDHGARDHASANLILVGDTFHNLLDGVLVAAAFMTNPHLGIVTARRGWVEPRHVLNTRPLPDVRAVIAAKRAAR